MREVSVFRLYLLRAMYLLLAAGQGSQMWPLIINHKLSWPLMHSVVGAMLAAIAAVAVIGLRYPLQMLPLLFFEMAWKVIWLAGVAFPLWRAGQIDPATQQSIFETSLVIIVPLVIPWGYVFDHYVKKPGDRWR